MLDLMLYNVGDVTFIEIFRHQYAVTFFRQQKILPSGVRGLKNVSQQFGVLMRVLHARLLFFVPRLLFTSFRQFTQ